MERMGTARRSRKKCTGSQVLRFRSCWGFCGACLLDFWGFGGIGALGFSFFLFLALAGFRA